mgnify:CR=1 FL=1
MGEVKDIMDKIKKYGTLRVTLCHTEWAWSQELETEVGELLSEIEEDLKQLVQENDWPKRDNLPVENYD